VEKALTGSFCLKPQKEKKKIKVNDSNMCLQEVYNHYGSEFSQVALVELMKQQGMKVSKNTVQRIFTILS
jgi:hypothetical protein